MHRLLQGEVGSGKTVVALRAMLRVVDSGGQAALLAPTEVLAQQHHRSITAMLGDLAAGGMLGGAADGTTVALLTGSMAKAARAEAMLDGWRRGEAGIVIGTHALLEEQVQFADLGLVVVDEQHRFGVEQRAALTDKAGAAAARAGDDRDADPAHRRDDGLRRPRGLDADRAARRPRADPDQRRAARRAARTGSTGSGSGSARRSRRATRPTSCARASAATSWSRARPTSDDDDEDATPSRPPVRWRRRGGRAELAERPARRAARRRCCTAGCAPDDKDRVMRAFAAGEIDVLVSTTVIEVGVDVANATMMVILDADRFGVSQLHQLRGRVGRGGLPGLCLLVTDAEPGTPGPRAARRGGRAPPTASSSRRVDLEQRREGDVLGASQSGRRSSLRLLRGARATRTTIVEAREAATALVERRPDARPATRRWRPRCAALEQSTAVRLHGRSPGATA